VHCQQENFRNQKLEYKQRQNFLKILKKLFLFPLRVKLSFMLLKKILFLQIFVVNVGYKTRWKLKLVGNELLLFDGVCKCQKWVENANQTQLKPMIWYTSWYFSRGVGGKKTLGGKKNS